MHVLESSPENVEWGQFDPSRDPVLEVSSGETVKIETVTPPRENHVEFLEREGIDREDVLEDEVNVAEHVEKTGPGPHVVTGPVAIENAKPGDILEVQMRDIEFRTPYGVNLFAPIGGELPDEFPYEEVRAVPFDLENGTAQFGADIDIPLEPFLGILAVSPAPMAGKTDTAPPGYFGGNLDLKQLGAGATLYLPVNAERALFWAGDGHGVQGNGEVCLTAAETSLTATFEFELHESDTRLTWPVAETNDHYVVMGIDPDLDEAMSHAVRECVSFLSTHEGLTEAEAYRLASLAVDFNVSQVVNGNKGIHGLIPKSLFDDDGSIDLTNLGGAPSLKLGG